MSKKWNKTEVLLNISKQINGVSPYSPLPGKIGYECSGGLAECINSCCLDGFCVEILFYCYHTVENIKLIYILGASGFILVLCVYWSTFFIIGCNFNEKMKKEDRESQNYEDLNNEEEERFFDYVDFIQVGKKKKKNLDSRIEEENEEDNFKEMTNKNFVDFKEESGISKQKSFDGLINISKKENKMSFEIDEKIKCKSDLDNSN